MNLILDVQNDKIPFFLELIKHLDFVNVIRMENTELTEVAAKMQASNSTSLHGNLQDDVSDLQDEINDLMG